jgi:hypothetical protein
VLFPNVSWDLDRLFRDQQSHRPSSTIAEYTNKKPFAVRFWFAIPHSEAIYSEKLGILRSLRPATKKTRQGQQDQV